MLVFFRNLVINSITVNFLQWRDLYKHLRVAFSEPVIAFLQMIHPKPEHGRCLAVRVLGSLPKARHERHLSFIVSVLLMLRYDFLCLEFLMLEDFLNKLLLDSSTLV